MRMDGVPTDLGPYGVLTAIVIALAVGFAVAVKWLDARDRARAAGFEDRIAKLEAKMLQMESSQSQAREYIAEALSMLPKELADVAAKLIQAVGAIK